MATKKEVLKEMLFRQPVKHLNRLHPSSKRIMDKMTQEPLPLKYKLQDLPEGQNPFIPLGVKEDIPFKVGRTHTGNLPVYTFYSHGGLKKRTRIRHILGDIDEFSQEVSKVVSNAEVIKKVGRIDIVGLHQENVTLWLKRLGF